MVSSMSTRNDIRENIISGIIRGNYYSLLGPRYSEKTLFLQMVIEELEKDDFMKCIYWEASELQRITKTKTLFNQIKKKIANKLREDNEINIYIANKKTNHYESRKLLNKPINSGNQFKEFLFEILKNNNFRFILILNRLQLLPKYVTRGVLSCLREVYNSRVINEEFTRLNVIISGSSNLLEFTKAPNSPFNISHPLLLGHLTRDEAQSKLKAYSEHEIYCTKKARDYLLSEFNNHPYFISNISPIIFKHVHNRDEHAVTLEHATKYLSDFIRDQAGEISDKYLKEMVARIKDDIQIYESILDLLKSEKIRLQEPELGVSKFTLSGAMIEIDRILEFTNNVVRRFLKIYLNDRTKGDIFLRFGKWEKALEHYKKYKSNPDRRLKVFELKRVEEATTSLLLILYKCLEEEEVWEYFVNSLYYILSFDSVEVFELDEKEHLTSIRLIRRHSRNPRHGKVLTITGRSENLARYALESNQYVLSYNGGEAAFPAESWDGHRKWIVLVDMINIKKDIDTEICEVIDLYLSITIAAVDRIKMEEKYRHEMEEIISIKEQSFNEIAHQMKTPLIGVEKLSRNVMNLELDDIQKTNVLHTIAGEAQKALKFTNQILDLNYLKHSNKAFQFEMNPISRIVREAINNNVPIADMKNIAIELKEKEENIYAEVNEENLIKALSNIINNAVKYSPNNTKIHVSLAEKNKKIEFTVRDQGIGIPENEFPLIFEKHERGEYAKDIIVEGIGIGLAITKLIVEKHSGSIHVDSTIGQGSTFTIIIPKEKEKKHA